MAYDTVERLCKDNINNISKIHKGGLIFLESQSRLWDGMLREFEKAESKGVPILPKNDSYNLKKPNTPNTTFNPESLQKFQSNPSLSK